MTWGLDRLTELVTDAVIAQLRAQLGTQLGAQPGLAEPPCACHHLSPGQCPDVMRPLVERGAERFGLTASAPHAGLSALIDHTLLKTRRDRRTDSKTVRGGSRVQVRDGMHPAHMGALRRPSASWNRRWRVHRRRVPARRETLPTSRPTRPAVRFSTVQRKSTWSSISALSNRAITKRWKTISAASFVPVVKVER